MNCELCIKKIAVLENLETYPALLSLMGKRYSCRAYDPDRIPGQDLIGAVIDAARIAPSACNRQPWLFLVVEGDRARDVMARAYSREWILTAPAFIIALGDHDTAWHRPCDGKDHTDVDISIAVEHICLAASALGLGTCWVCNFDPKVIIEAYDIPSNLEPVAIIPIGYPAEGSPVPVKTRKSTEEIIRWGKL